MVSLQSTVRGFLRPLPLTPPTLRFLSLVINVFQASGVRYRAEDGRRQELALGRGHGILASDPRTARKCTRFKLKSLCRQVPDTSTVRNLKGNRMALLKSVGRGRDKVMLEKENSCRYSPVGSVCGRIDKLIAHTHTAQRQFPKSRASESTHARQCPRPGSPPISL